jgi:N-formylglutamate amidohydrolase
MITEAVYKSLARNYHTVVNTPYKGGYLTKYFAKPKQGIHTIQLEISQDLYLAEPTESDLLQPGFPTLSPGAHKLSAALQIAVTKGLNALFSESINS